MSTVEPTMLEREHALVMLDAAFREAVAGRGRIALVFGEAGIGKTTLVRAFAGEAGKHARVIWGACEALLTPRPFGPVHDIATGLGDQVRDALAGSDRVAIHAALLSELGATPTVAVLEDLHWADEATLDAISFLGRRLDTVPCLLVLTYRDHELAPGHALRSVVGELPSATTARISLGRLSVMAVERLAALANRPPGGLYEATGGNPFFLTEVLAAPDDVIPMTVRDAVLARTGRLTPGGRNLADAVAVIPGGTESWLVERLAPGAIEYLDECLAAGVLRATPTGVEFRHELARLAINESLRPDRRVALHVAALEALADRPSEPADLAALAHHAEEAHDTAAVVRFAPAAAERAARVGAHREAAAQYERALRFSDGLPLETRAALSEALSYESYLTGDFVDAIEASTRALGWYRKCEDVRGEGSCLRSLARLLWSSGRTSEAEAPLREAVVLLDSVHAERELALTYSELASLAGIRADYDAVLEWGSAAVELAERLGDRETLASARLELSAAAYATGAADGRERLERELEHALSAELEEVAARAFNLLGRLAVQTRDYAFADRYLERGFEYCRDRELGNFRQGMAVVHARRLFDRGEWERASAMAGSVLTTARTSGMAPFEALTLLGQVRARRGDPDVWPPLNRALEMAELGGELRRIGLVTAARADAAWLAGDRERALAEAEAGFELAVEKRHAWFGGELAYWRWACGGMEPPDWIAEPYVLEISGERRLAADVWLDLDCPYEAARALVGADDPRDVLHALEIFDRLGAAPAAQLARRALRELGSPVPRGPRSSTRTNPAQLTARELEVLALMSDGLRNTDIATRLVVSRRTVDHHVSAILRKLGARTRGEAVSQAGRLGLLEDRQRLFPT